MTGSVFTTRFIADREDDGFVLYVELEPILAFAREMMDDEDRFLRFELGVRRAADEMRDHGAAPRRRWWKPRGAA